MRLRTILLLCLHLQLSFSQIWSWAWNGGLDLGTKVATDNQDNVIVVCEGYGLYGSAQSPVITEGAMAKHDSKGNLLWVVALDNSAAADVCTDSNGNIYITGRTHQIGKFWGTSGSFTVFTPGSHLNGFVAMYSPAGKIQWVSTFGGLDDDDLPSGIVQDTARNTYIVGVSTKKASPSVLNNYFIKKYDPVGTLLWQKDSQWKDWVQGIDIDADRRNVYVSGIYGDTAVFDQHTLSCSPLPFATFVAKYEFSGTLNWVKSIGNNAGSNAHLAIDDSSNIFLSGMFTVPVNFDGIQVPVPSSGLQGCNIFVKMDSSGTAKWVKTAEKLIVFGIAFDPKGRVVVGGRFKDTATINSSPPITLTTPKNGEVFSAVFDRQGTVTKALQGIGPKGRFYTQGNGVACDRSGGIWITGTFYDTTSFGSYTLMNASNIPHQFLAKIDTAVITTSMLLRNLEKLQVIPSIGSGLFKINRSIEASDKLIIFNSLGQEVPAIASFGGIEPIINLNGHPSGIYQLYLTSDGRSYSGRLVLQD